MDLVEYVKDDKGRNVGCVVATGKNNIGYSICHREDVFEKNIGRKIATERAKKGKDYLSILKKEDSGPEKYKTHFVVKKLEHFKERVNKYFKD